MIRITKTTCTGSVLNELIPTVKLDGTTDEATCNFVTFRAHKRSPIVTQTPPFGTLEMAWEDDAPQPVAGILDAAMDLDGVEA